MKNLRVDRPRIMAAIAMIGFSLVVVIAALFPSFSTKALYSHYPKQVGGSEGIIDIDFHYEFTESRLFPATLSMVVDYINVRDDIWAVYGEPGKVGKVCIGDLYLRLGIDNRNYSTGHGVQSFIQYRENSPEHKNYCYSYNPNHYGTRSRSAQAVDQSVSIDLRPEIFYAYPFDSMNLEIDSSAEVLFFDTEGNLLFSQTLVPSFSMPDVIDRWIVRQDRADGFLTDGGESDHYRYSMTLARPVYLRVLTAIILLCLLVIPATIPLVGDFTSAIEISIAFFLGIWGVKLILLPGDVSTTTIIDIILLGDYIALFLALIVSIGLFVFRKKGK